MNNNYILIAPKEYYQLTPEEKGEVCHGCGSLGINVPDHLLGLSIHEACNIHDYMYNIGETITDKQEADSIFYYNMCILISRGSSNRFILSLRKYLAMTYFLAVYGFGIFSFIPSMENYYDSIVSHQMQEQSQRYYRGIHNENS